MEPNIYSMWQDYETHLFTCENCKTQTLGENLMHDFEASESVLSLDCPSCAFRVALLNIQATKDEIAVLAAMGYETALAQQAKQGERWYESYPDFTNGLTPEESVERAAYAIEFMADPKLSRPAIQLMDMLAFGIMGATSEIPYLCEEETGDANPFYFQIIRGRAGEYFVELASMQSRGRPENQSQTEILESLGWLSPNFESPNFHREYAWNASRIQIAAASAVGWIRGNFPVD